MIRGEQTKAAFGENSSLLGIGFLANQVSVIVHYRHISSPRIPHPREIQIPHWHRWIKESSQHQRPTTT